MSSTATASSVGSSAAVCGAETMPNTKPIGVAYEDQQLDGAILGKSGGTIGFYGTTPVTRASAITALVTTPASTDIATAVNSIITALKNIGITA